jgi:hypothetical protein
VKDQKGAPVKGAEVTVEGKSGAPVRLLSQGPGFYLARGVPEGVYTVRVKVRGRVTKREGIRREKASGGGCPSWEGIEPSLIGITVE